MLKEIDDILVNNSATTPIPVKEKIATALSHINAIHRYYGTGQGVRIARKHIGWYLSHLVGHKAHLLKPLTRELFPLSDANEQLDKLDFVLNNLEKTLQDK